MFPVPLFPERASTTADQVDALFFFLLAVTGSAALLIAVLIVYYSVRYRRRAEGPRPPRIEGAWRLEVFWSVVPLLIFLVMFAWGAHGYFALTQPPDDAIEIYVVGKQWMWKVQHPGGQREINELHVPVNQPVKLILTSEDVVHDFFVPAFRTKVDVLPNRYVYTWFQATKPGRYHLFCAQYCGTNHAGMVGEVVVMEQADYEDWLSGHAEGSLALEGRKLFLKLQCVTCHSADSGARGPVLENLYGREVRLRDGRTVPANESYIKESILDPQAKVVAGFEPIMPTYKGQVNEDEMIQLIEFIKNLRAGQTPTRTEEGPPPAVQPGAR
jgi:cytochrome c oxidase subunit 2